MVNLSAQPQPADELVLLLCATRERRLAHGGRIEDLLAGADRGAIAAAMHRHGLMPILRQRIGSEFAENPAGAELAERLAPAADALASRGHTYSVALKLIQRTLDARDVASLPIKGPALSEALYGDPGLRPASDLDILVAAERLADVARALAERGYEPDSPTAATGRLPRLHMNLVHRAGLLPPLEVHWRIHWYETAFAREMLASSREVGGGRRAEPAHELTSLLLFFARDGFQGLRFPADVAQWWDLNGATEPEQAVLDPILRRYPPLAEALVAAAHVVDRLVGVPVARTVGNGAPRRRATRIAVRLQNWSAHDSANQLAANMTLVDGLLSPAGERGAFARRWLFPGRASLAATYGVDPASRGRIAFLAAWHPAKLAARYVVAFASVARRSGRAAVQMSAIARAGEARKPPRSSGVAI